MITFIDIGEHKLLINWSFYVANLLVSLDFSILLIFLISCSPSTRHLHYLFFELGDQIVFSFHISFKLVKLSLSLFMSDFQFT